MTEPRTRVVIADDDRVVRDALADLISSQPDLELAGTAVDHPDALRVSARQRPQVLVLDVRMPRGTAAATVRAIRDRAPTVGVLILSAYEDPAGAVEVLAAGASGYLVKGVADAEVLEGINRTARGQLSISASLAAECLGFLRRHPPEGAAPRDAALLAQLLDRGPYAAVVVDPGGHIELANARVEQLFGYRRSDLLGQRIATLAPATTAGEAPEDLVRRLLPAEVPPDAVARVTTTGRRQDGSEFPVEISAAGLAPDLHAVAVFFRDITALRDTESRYQRLFEASPEAIVVVDPSGLIQHVNAAAERLFGHPREELVGQTVDALLPDHPVAIYRREADQVPTGPGAPPTPVGLELVGRSRDGTEFPVEMSVGHVRTDAGQVMLLIRDMTEVAGSRAVLEHSIEVLRAAGQEHRNVLVDLVRAQERERLRIAAGIHDDSLQVITAASLRLQQLRRRLRDPEDLKIMAKVEETIKLAADRLRRMIFDFRPPALEEEGVVTALQIYLDQLHEDTGLSYRLDSQLEQEPPLEARVVIYRIAQEALMNVRKHARANRVRVQLSPADGGCLVEIVDDGVGYYPQRTEARSGHLGLILMRDRAEIAGGWCRVESAPGEGTTVEFWIPLDLGAAPGNDGETGPGGR